MPDVEILGLPQSNFVWTTRIACAAKGVSHTVTLTPPKEAGHPLGKIPVLRHGAVTLFESRAIAAYIDAAFDGPALASRDPVEAARQEQWVSMIVTAMEPVMIRQYLFAYMFPKGADGGPDRVAVAGVEPALREYLQVLSEAIEGKAFGGGPLQIVDCYLTPILFYLRGAPESGEAIAAAAPLRSYLDRRLAEPAVASTVPPPL